VVQQEVVEMAFDFDQKHRVVEVDMQDIHRVVEVDMQDIRRVVEVDKVDNHLGVDKLHYTYLDLDSLYKSILKKTKSFIYYTKKTLKQTWKNC
jgi:hypothetical protein